LNNIILQGVFKGLR